MNTHTLKDLRISVASQHISLVVEQAEERLTHLVMEDYLTLLI